MTDRPVKGQLNLNGSRSRDLDGRGHENLEGATPSPSVWAHRCSHLYTMRID